MKQFDELKALVAQVEPEIDKVVGNKAAARRVRKGLMDIKKKAGEIRKELVPAKLEAAAVPATRPALQA